MYYSHDYNCSISMLIGDSKYIMNYLCQYSQEDGELKYIFTSCPRNYFDEENVESFNAIMSMLENFKINKPYDPQNEKKLDGINEFAGMFVKGMKNLDVDLQTNEKNFLSTLVTYIYTLTGFTCSVLEFDKESSDPENNENKLIEFSKYRIKDHAVINSENYILRRNISLPDNIVTIDINYKN
jgi:hypothetical protein